MNPRRLSQAISEGDGISVIAEVDGPEAARDAEDAGAEGLVIPDTARAQLPSIRGATDLPIVAVVGEGASTDSIEGADACIVDVSDDEREPLERVQRELGESFELAFRIATEDHLAFVLEEFDPEILVLAGSAGGAPLERVLDLLPDVPAGKLAIADVRASSRDEVEELERAGVDGVIVAAGTDVAELVIAAPPEV